MIYTNVPVEIQLTPDDIESELWMLGASEQSEFILKLYERSANNPYFLSQLGYIKDSLEKFDDDTKKSIKDMFKTFYEYFCED